MLNNDDILWLIDIAKSAARGVRDLPVDVTAGEVNERLITIMARLDKPVEPLELLIYCPRCLKQHIDVGEFAKHAHKMHACQYCGLGFSASGSVPSVGVQFFRGWRNEPHIEPTPGGKPHLSPGVIPAGMEITARIGDVVQVFTGQRW